MSNGAHESGHLYMQIATEEAGFDHAREDGTSVEQSCCQSCVESMVFQMTIGAVITANAVVIGMETDMRGHGNLWQELEDAFLLIFLLELLLKLCVYGCIGFFNSPDRSWNVFDFLIVTLGVTDRVVSHISSEQKGSGARFFVLLMRTFRLLRLLRIIRIFRLMKQLYLLANSMVDAASAVLWVSVLCVLILYVAAVVVTRLVGQPGLGAHDAPLLDEFRVEHFGSVPTSMMTLFRLMTFPDLDQFKPVCDVMPGMTGFFIGFIILMSFGMVSLLTGVITESLLEKSRHREDERRFERERARRLLAEDLRRCFQGSSPAGPGVLNKLQFEQCKEEVLRLCSQHSMRLRPKDLDALFELVDDGSGNIDAEELLYGMVQLNSEVRPMAVMELRRLVVRGVHGIAEQMSTMDARMQMMDRRMIELQAAARFGALAPPAGAEVPTQSSVVPPPPPVTSIVQPPAPGQELVDLLGGS